MARILALIAGKRNYRKKQKNGRTYLRITCYTITIVWMKGSAVATSKRIELKNRVEWHNELGEKHRVDGPAYIDHARPSLGSI